MFSSLFCLIDLEIPVCVFVCYFSQVDEILIYLKRREYEQQQRETVDREVWSALLGRRRLVYSKVLCKNKTAAS